MRLVWKVLSRLFEVTARAGRVFWWAFLVMGAAGLLVMTVFIALRIATSITGRSKTRPQEITQKTEEEGPTTAQQALQHAEEAAKRGDYRQALRNLYRALLLFLVDRGLLRFQKATTNWEYVRALRAVSEEVGASFGDSTLLFERCWYGRTAATPAHYASLLDGFGALKAAFVKGRGEA